MNKKFNTVFVLIFIAIFMGSCASPATPTQAPAPTKPPAPTQAPPPTQAPTQAPTQPPPPTPTTAPTVAPTVKPTEAPTEAPVEGGIPADAALKVTGKVKTPIGWTEAQVKAMTTLQVEAKNKKGETSKYTGVLIADLLKLAGPLPEATKVIFVASDGYTAEISLADVMACTNCIVSFRDQGGFSTVLPDSPGNLQVKGVVELKVE
jgi:DMSO/TMAO reductase YedYZ molybdopterin-dependent catalytic subunit